DLDLKPYRDYHDFELMQRMEKAIDAGKLPKASAALKREIASYNAAFRDEHRDVARAAKRKAAKKSARKRR
ncbi:MAG TPA: hypothetical protein VF264_04475, partial [Rhodanobacteraceae bacterium]